MSIEEALMTDAFGKPETWRTPIPRISSFAIVRRS